MKVLVTGSSGYLGRSVVWELRSRGHAVIACSRAGTVPENPFGVDASTCAPVVGVVRVDLAHDEAVDKLAEILEPDTALVHLAAWHPPGTANTGADQRRTLLEVNTMGTMRVLDAARKKHGHVTAFVYSSSFEVYGAPEVLPITEDHPTHPLTDYGATKLSGEDHVISFGAEEGVRCICLRLPAIYGPGEVTERALPNFLRAVARGSAPAIEGDGEDQRDQLFVADAARAVALTLDSAAHGIFNVSDGEPHRIVDLARCAMRVAGMPGVPTQRPRVKPHLDYHMSIARARDLLGFAPKVSLEEGMAREFRWLTRPT